MTSLQSVRAEAAPANPTDCGAWQDLYTDTSASIRECVARIVREHAAMMASLFYETLLEDPQAAPLLSHELVGHRLHGSLQRWMLDLFRPDEQVDIAPMAAMQVRIGTIHARVGVSYVLVTRGARILKNRIGEYLRASELDRIEISLAHQYVEGLFDFALEVMNSTYLKDARRGARADEAYRLFSLGQNVAAEREMQRALLLEWSQAVLFHTHRQGHDIVLPTLRHSDFGLWLYHKGSAMFARTSELPPILDAVAELDGKVLPALGDAVRTGNGARLSEHILVFQHKINDIKFLLMTLFDRVAEVEGGRDPLTQLMNRRFLPTVLGREIAMATQGKSTFSLFLTDIDHFKQINDMHGHGGGDAVLRQMAELLQETCRVGDYVFRYGGEEFMVVMVDADASRVTELVEKLRCAIERHSFRLPDGNVIKVTTSIGVALFDGHPDPDVLISRADRALYDAKAAGRNCWRVAP